MDNRLFIDAILWMAGDAACWRDLTEVFGNWTGVHACFRHWSHAGVRKRLFVADTPDFEYVLIDSTIQGPRRCQWRKREAEDAAIKRFRGSLTTKLLNTIGLPIRIHPTPGQWGDHPQVETLMAGLKGVGHVIADAAYDADPLCHLLSLGYDFIATVDHVEGRFGR